MGGKPELEWKFDNLHCQITTQEGRLLTISRIYPHMLSWELMLPKIWGITIWDHSISS